MSSAILLRTRSSLVPHPFSPIQLSPSSPLPSHLHRLDVAIALFGLASHFSLGFFVPLIQFLLPPIHRFLCIPFPLPLCPDLHFFPFVSKMSPNFYLDTRNDHLSVQFFRGFGIGRGKKKRKFHDEHAASCSYH